MNPGKAGPSPLLPLSSNSPRGPRQLRPGCLSEAATGAGHSACPPDSPVPLPYLVFPSQRAPHWESSSTRFFSGA